MFSKQALRCPLFKAEDGVHPIECPRASLLAVSVKAVGHHLACAWSVAEVYLPEYGAPISGATYAVAIESIVHSFARELRVEPLRQGMCICLASQEALLHIAEVAMHFERLFGGKVVEPWLPPLLLLVTSASLLGLASLLPFLCNVLLAW